MRDEIGGNSWLGVTKWYELNTGQIHNIINVINFVFALGLFWIINHSIRCFKYFFICTIFSDHLTALNSSRGKWLSDEPIGWFGCIKTRVANNIGTYIPIKCKFVERKLTIKVLLTLLFLSKIFCM